MDGAQPLLEDVILFLIQSFYHHHACSRFYDIYALAVCWSQVSIRRIIYEFLNQCPLDCNVVAGSGKFWPRNRLTTLVGLLDLLQLTIVSRSVILVLSNGFMLFVYCCFDLHPFSVGKGAFLVG